MFPRKSTKNIDCFKPHTIYKDTKKLQNEELILNKKYTCIKHKSRSDF